MFIFGPSLIGEIQDLLCSFVKFSQVCFNYIHLIVVISKSLILVTINLFVLTFALLVCVTYER